MYAAFYIAKIISNVHVCMHTLNLAFGFLYMSRNGENSVTVYNVSGSTIRATAGPRRAELSMFNSSVSATSNNLLAYYPTFNSGLAAFLINMAEAFPCIQLLPGYNPACQVLAFDNDGFSGGRAIIEASDAGNVFGHVFTGAVKGVFAFGLSGCPELDCDCFPVYTEYLISCFLPRDICG